MESKKYLIEVIGTFTLVLTVALSSSPLAAAAILTAAVYAGGPISGAHFNPAVSLAMWLRRSLTIRQLGAYTAAQMLGGLGAAAVAFAITATKFTPGLPEGGNWWSALTAEAIFTFILALTVLLVATTKKSEGNSYFGLAIGLVIVAAGLSIGSISGAALNPAVGVSPLLFDLANITRHWPSMLLYLAGPLLGGLVAGLIYPYLTPDKA